MKISKQYFIIVNPFTDEQLNLLGTMPKQVCHYSSLHTLFLGCKTIRRRADRFASHTQYIK